MLRNVLNDFPTLAIPSRSSLLRHMKAGYAKSVLASIAKPLLHSAALATLFLESGLAISAETCRLARVLIENGVAIADPSPAIEWVPIRGVERYRLRLESRIPEGRVLEVIDSVVEGTSFQPPVALTDTRARVKVVVTEACGSTPPIDDGAWFIIDPAPQCRLDPASVEFAGDSVQWSAVSGAVEYDFRVHDMPGGRLSFREMTIRPEVRWGSALRADAVVVVRPKCTSGYGEPHYFVRLEPVHP